MEKRGKSVRKQGGERIPTHYLNKILTLLLPFATNISMRPIVKLVEATEKAASPSKGNAAVLFEVG
ncbi:MAG: hypothetical protein K2G29_03430 [Muribaculaceae bacterium]|nr:hypothetical protein [Muribaculaceae bacterium]MDE6423036.1 hypothetical protein [Muribaculaceae bacterium]